MGNPFQGSLHQFLCLFVTLFDLSEDSLVGWD